MSTDPNKKTLRHFQCRDYLWETFEQMSAELECSVDYLINEAMRQYARSRGHAGAVTAAGRAAPDEAPAPAAPAGRPAPPAMPAVPVPTSNRPPPAMPGAPRPGGNAGMPAPPPVRAPGIPPLPGAGAVGSAAPPGAPRIPSLGGTGAPPPRPGGPGMPPAMPQRPGAPALPPLGRGAAPGGAAPPPMPGRPSGPPPAMPAGMPSLPRTGGPPVPQMPPRQAPPPMPAAVPGAGTGTLSAIYQGQRYPVDKEEFVIGRGQKTSDLVIKDSNVSRRHAVVVLHNGQYWIVDQQSTNGVEFMGAKIDRKRIDEGDVFKICDYEIQFTYR